MRKPVLGPGREFDILRRLIERQRTTGVASDRVVVGPGDDAVVLRGEQVALSVDLSVENVHFRREWLDPYEIGYRSATAALSDLAAVAAAPVGVLVSLALAGEDVERFADGIGAGIEEAATARGAIVLGGDLTRSPGPIVVDIVVIGDARTPVLRDGARVGDEVWVTGALGGASAALAAWLAGENPSEAAVTAYRRPVARTAEALWLAERQVPHAMIDLSDGLAGDAGHVAAASGVAVVIETDRVPIHPGTRAVPGREPLAFALGGGDDYELCFTAAPGAVEPIAEEFRRTFDLPLTRVGVVEEGTGVELRGAGGLALQSGVAGFSHFGEPGS